jgi:DNA-binding LytR/AlgR family response regulator
MPEIDGLGVVRLLRKNMTPLIGFVTAYDEYAVRAFEVNAVDYLLKPVDKARLRETLNRAEPGEHDWRTMLLVMVGVLLLCSADRFFGWWDAEAFGQCGPNSRILCESHE